MRSVAVIAAILAAAVVVGLIARAGAASRVVAFRTPDAGAACRLEGTALVCSALESPGSVALRPRDVPRIVKRAPWWDASTPVVEHWRSGPLSCRLADTALICRNDRAGIRVTAGGFVLL
jgi:hypothetical protein